MFKSKNINDVLLLNDDKIVPKFKIDETEFNDHKIIEFSLNIPIRKTSMDKKEILLFKNGDYKMINYL
jgi:hypothetical protein